MSSFVRFEYQYRDADNYKNWGELFFDNRSNLSVDSIQEDIKKSLLDNVWFIAHQVAVPELFLFDACNVTIADHCFHELLSIQTLFDVSSPEKVKEPIEHFVIRFQKAFAEGWQVFDPTSRFAQ